MEVNAKITNVSGDSEDPDSDVGPIENIVAILVPAPGVVLHTFILIVDDKSAEINEEYPSPILCKPQPLQAALANIDCLGYIMEEEALQA